MYMSENIHIFMCTWKRIHNLNTLLENLNDQTCSPQIIFNIWNNNIDEKNNIYTIINSAKDIKYKINVEHSEKNMYAFGRYLYMKQLYDEYKFKYAIIIDDDQLFSNDYFEKLWNLRKKNTFITWYGAILNGRKYWDRSVINIQDIIFGRKREIQEYEYGGPGGSIIDVSIVLEENFMKEQEKYILADDLWLSYYVKNKLNWRIERSFLIPILLETQDDLRHAMWTLYANKKEKIYEELRKN